VKGDEYKLNTHEGEMKCSVVLILFIEHSYKEKGKVSK